MYMSNALIDNSTPYKWVSSIIELPLHKEIVDARVEDHVTQVFYSVRECGWFDLKKNPVKVYVWRKVEYTPGYEFTKTRFFRRTKAS